MRDLDKSGDLNVDNEKFIFQNQANLTSAWENIINLEIQTLIILFMRIFSLYNYLEYLIRNMSIDNSARNTRSYYCYLTIYSDP